VQLIGKPLYRTGNIITNLLWNTRVMTLARLKVDTVQYRQLVTVEAKPATPESLAHYSWMPILFYYKLFIVQCTITNNQPQSFGSAHI
jgi:hypothetical protein